MRLGYVIMYVRDIQKTFIFYKKAFGLKRRFIHEASGGEPTAWWEWTSKRKSLQKKGLLNHVIQNSQK